MRTITKAVILTVVLGGMAFLSGPFGPLGGFWRPGLDVPVPNGVQTAFLSFLAVFEALVFGAGVSFLIFAYPLVKSVLGASVRLARVTHVSIAWLMINWWPHDSMHIHNGLDLNGLIGIDYVFHFTIMAAGLVVAYFFLALLGGKAERPAATSR